MGNTLWMLEENQHDDNFDHSIILQESKYLDTLCTKLQLPKLSTYFDESILAEEFGINVEPKYIDATFLKKVFSSLIEEIPISTNIFLIEELKDLLQKCTLAQKKNTKVRLALVA